MIFDNLKIRQINETEEFKIFSGEMNYLGEFLLEFAELISFNGHTISLISENQHFILNTSLIESSAKTLKSIELCCSIGGFSDANTLIRKLRDDLLQYLYILEIIKKWDPFVEERLFSKDEQAVLGWFNNEVSNLLYDVKKRLGFNNYMEILGKDINISRILQDYKLNVYWEVLRERLNDYVHSNGSDFDNDNLVFSNNEYLETYFKNVSLRASYICSLFITLLLMINSSLISSTDHIDYLDCKLTPPIDSQYWIPDFIQEFIDNKVAKLHPELKQFIKDNNVHGMNIE